MRALLIALPVALALTACSDRGEDKAAPAAPAAASKGAEVALTDLDQPAPGLWEQRMEGGPAGQAMGAMTIRTCVGPAKPGQNPFQPPEGAGGDCATDSVRRVGSDLVFKSVCAVEGGQMTTQGKVSGDLKQAYRIALTMSHSGGGPAQSMTMSARRVGDCPAGMAPGAVAP